MDRVDVWRPFVGAEALAAGVLNRHQLRTRCCPTLPGVYLRKGIRPTLRARTHAAYLWSRRNGVVAGLAAAAFHGARWVDEESPIELIYRSTRPPAGVVCRADRLLVDEVMGVDGLPVTTPARTAFDIGRRGRLDSAVAALDALLHATGVPVAAVAAIAARHPHVRGLRQLETALELVDAGAESPKETWLRLLVHRDGLPPVETQIEVRVDGRLVARLDMGWPELQIALEYDGDQHQSDRDQYLRDMRRLDQLTRLGWIVVRVVKEDRPADVLRRVREAIDARR
ncbi:hypothetical protein LV457_11310 [Mycobacterium sp. MYCO198283]|uniref:endonuclease domain-containing protein n=1 Tax=Mycobacterium sp. MYCO198283 TaxID=2883505 RepID=UPI001E64BBDF|nr:hypothetical protein [Mycobacterium sp. MYCO198283]MCG5432872.1 hypothetical protein [Mycobacterium sp. MYCO198283]